MITTSIVIDHRGRVPKNQEAPLEVRITVDRKSYYVNTGIRVRRAQWRTGSVVDRPDSVELNERLRIIERKVASAINVCLDNDNPIDVAEIRREVTTIADRTEQDNSFLNWLEDEVRVLPIKEGTRKHYNTLVTRMSEWRGMCQWSDVTPAKVIDFDVWLKNLSLPLTKAQSMINESDKANGRKLTFEQSRLSLSGVHNYHKTLKKMLYLAVKKDMIDVNPYQRLRGEFKRGDKETVEYLTMDEVNKIRKVSYEVGSHLCMVRDLFVFQIFTGMAYSDMQRFDIGKYKKVEGRWLAVDERIKTGSAFIAQLLPPVVEVLERYGWKVPRISIEVYNRSLKKIQEDTGITTRLHSHLARHTFATIMLNNDVDVTNLQRMMGHTDIKTTLRYAKTLAQSVHDDYDRISAKLFTN